MKQYGVERRGNKYFLYDPSGTKIPGWEAFCWDRKNVDKIFAYAEQLNKTTK